MTSRIRAKASVATGVLGGFTTFSAFSLDIWELVDRNRAVAAVFDLARRERDSWLNLPPRVAATMAAELGVEAHHMEQVLDRVLRAHLAELAEVKLELR